MYLKRGQKSKSSFLRKKKPFLSEREVSWWYCWWSHIKLKSNMIKRSSAFIWFRVPFFLCKKKNTWASPYFILLCTKLGSMGKYRGRTHAYACAYARAYARAYACVRTCVRTCVRMSTHAYANATFGLSHIFRPLTLLNCSWTTFWRFVQHFKDTFRPKLSKQNLLQNMSKSRLILTKEWLQKDEMR